MNNTYLKLTVASITSDSTAVPSTAAAEADSRFDVDDGLFFMVTNDGSTPSEDVDDVANGIGVVVSDFVEPAVKIFFFIFLHLRNKIKKILILRVE